MLEELCRNAMDRLCRDVCDAERRTPVRRGDVRQFTDFLPSRVLHNWKAVPLDALYRSHGMAHLTRQKAWVFFNEHDKVLVNAFLNDRYSGDIRAAMTAAGSFDSLWQQFTDFFNDRRNTLMDRQVKQITARRAELAKAGKHPQSHGGVANLLKVLTKTMHDQGSSITTIAKVQYTVCMQAGIFIPDDFLTDVLTASAIIGGDV